MLSNCFENVYTIHVTWTTRYFMISEQTCTIDPIMDQICEKFTYIFHMNTNSIVTWETLSNKADWHFKTPIVQNILSVQNLHQEEHCAFFGHTIVPINWMCKKQNNRHHFLGRRIEVGFIRT